MGKMKRESDLLKRDIRDFFGGKVFSRQKFGEKILVILIGAICALRVVMKIKKERKKDEDTLHFSKSSR